MLLRVIMHQPWLSCRRYDGLTRQPHSLPVGVAYLFVFVVQVELWMGFIVSCWLLVVESYAVTSRITTKEAGLGRVGSPTGSLAFACDPLNTEKRNCATSQRQRRPEK